MNDWFDLSVGDDRAGPVDLAIFGIAYDRSVFFRRGAAGGPARIRELSSKIPPCTESGSSLNARTVLDLGDIVPDSPDDELISYHDEIQARWKTARSRGLPLVLGGDHSISIPLFTAAARTSTGPFGVIWIDAHPDLCDEYDGSRFSHASVLRRALDAPNLHPEAVTMLSVRSYEVEELDYLATHPINVMTAAALASQHAVDVGRSLVEQYRDTPVYLSIDIDAFDPAYAPGTGIPDAGGLSTRWVLDLLHQFSSLDVLGIDLVEVAPRLDVPSDATSLLALKLILEMLHTFSGSART